jgi:hypothetical protein
VPCAAIGSPLSGDLLPPYLEITFVELRGFEISLGLSRNFSTVLKTNPEAEERVDLVGVVQTGRAAMSKKAKLKVD